MTVNQLKSLFQSIGNAHYFIKSTEFGDPPSKVDAEQDAELYPAFYQVLNDTIVRTQTIERTFTLIVCDLVFPGKENLDEVLSDTEQTLADIIKILRQESDYYNVIGDPTMIDFKDRYGDQVAGWQADVIVETQNNSAYCDIPSSIFGYPGGEGGPGIPGDDGFKCSDLLNCELFVNVQNDIIQLQTDVVNINNNIQSIETDITNIESSITQPDKQIVYGTGTGLTSNSHFTFDNTLSSNTIARMNIGDSNHQGQIDVTAFGGGSLLRIEAGSQIYFSNFGGNGFIFRPNGAVETMRMINDDLLIGHTSSALGRLDVRRTTIGSSIYASNNSYNLAGDSTIMIADGSGRTLGLGFSNTANGFFYTPIGGLYVHGYGVYGTFFESGNVTVPNKMLVGYNGYDGDLVDTLLNVNFEAHGGERFTDLAGTGTRMVVADSTGKLSTQSIPSSASLTDTYIGFGDASNVLTGSSSFTYNSTSGAVTIGGSVFYNRDLQISKSSNTSIGLIIQNTNTGSQANEDIVLIESGSIYTELGRNNTTVTGNFDGTNVAMGGSFFVINTQTSNDAPIFLRSSVNYSVIENTGTNMAVRHDATGWRLGPSSSIGTANTRPWEISGLVRLDNAYTFYTAPGEQSFIRIAPTQALIGNYSTFVEVRGFSSQNIDLVVSNVSKFNITSTQLSSSLLTGTGDRMVESSSTGVITATKELIEDWISDAGVQSDLEDTANWDVLGDYIGPTLSDTYQSQKHYDANYLFIAVTDNNFIRIPRV